MTNAIGHPRGRRRCGERRAIQPFNSILIHSESFRMISNGLKLKANKQRELCDSANIHCGGRAYDRVSEHRLLNRCLVRSAYQTERIESIDPIRSKQAIELIECGRLILAGGRLIHFQPAEILFGFYLGPIWVSF